MELVVDPRSLGHAVRAHGLADERGDCVSCHILHPRPHSYSQRRRLDHGDRVNRGAKLFLVVRADVV